MPFWQFFRKGWNGRALLVRPSKMHHSIWKIILVLGADEYLERLESKIRKCLFFYVKIFTNNSLIMLIKYLIEQISCCLHILRWSCFISIEKNRLSIKIMFRLTNLFCRCQMALYFRALARINLGKFLLKIQVK